MCLGYITLNKNLNKVNLNTKLHEFLNPIPVYQKNLAVFTVLVQYW